MHGAYVYRLADCVRIASFTTRHNGAEGMDEIMQKIFQTEAHHLHTRLTVTEPQQGAIHWQVGRSAMYVIVTSMDYPQRVAFRAGEQLCDHFERTLGDALHKADAGGLSKEARKFMEDLCRRYADAESVESTRRLMRDVDEVKGIVGESIQALLATNENLEVLEDRSEALRSQTSNFQKTARTVRKVQQRQNRKLGCVSCCFLLLAIVLVATPLFIMYRPEITEFFDDLLPPCDRSILRPESCNSNSTDAGSGEELLDTLNSSITPNSSSILDA